MAKILHSFTLDPEVSEKLNNVENKSGLLNDLLKTYFGTSEYSESSLERAKAKMELLKIQYEKEQDKANKIVVEEKEKEMILIETEKEKQEEAERGLEALELKIIEDEKALKNLPKELGFEPNGSQIAGYMYLIHNDEKDKAREFIEKWKLEREKLLKNIKKEDGNTANQIS